MDALPVSTVTYDLGDQAFTDPDVTFFDRHPGKPVPMELAAVVLYPTDLGRTRHPLIVIEHGSWWSCIDRAARKPTGGWPCKRGEGSLRSYRGYGYLATGLAERGFVVVSISANAINAHVLGDAGYLARAHLINRHLHMWQQLASTGRGPLRGTFVDPRTGREVRPGFRGRVDTRNVGTVGHSRAGKGVMWQASDKHRSEWPRGVRVRAVLPLAPVYFTPPGGSDRDTLVTKIPVKVITASCDGAVGEEGVQYVDDVEGRNPDASHESIAGGNHNHFNTRWSPGRIGGEDDAIDPCASKISAQEQRRRTRRLATAYFVETLRPSVDE